MNTKTNKRISSIFQYVFLTIIAFISIFPFYWMIAGATNSTTDIVQGKLLFGGELMNNLKTLVSQVDVGVVFYNTVKVTLISTVLALLVTSMAGYGFAKYKSKGKELMYNIILFSMMIPFAAMMIPLFQLTAKMGLIDTHIAVILPAIASVFLIFFFRQNFSTFPLEVIEAARIDGASEWRIFFNIVAPSMKSTYAAAAIWAFMSQWNNYLWPLLVLQTDGQKTLTLAISSMSSAYFVEYGPLMLAIVIATTPVIIMFLTMQKHFVAGMVGSNR